MSNKGSARVPVSTREAKEQAAEYFGFTASAYIRTENNKVFEIPNPAFLDDDQQERYEELMFVIEGCDREPDIEIPERTLEDGTVVPAQTIEGDYKKPYRVDGQLLKPPYATRLAMALFGDDYAEFKAAGGSGNQVQLEWARMNKEYADRLESDPKSDGPSSALEVVS